MSQKLIQFIPVESRKLISGQVLWFGVWVFTTICGILLRPSPTGFGTHRQLGLPQCPSITIFNRPCPGCGLTTSFTLTIHFRLQEAFFANPFGPIFYILLTIVGLVGGIAYFKKLYVDTSSKWIFFALLALTTSFIAFGIYRFFYEPIPIKSLLN